MWGIVPRFTATPKQDLFGSRRSHLEPYSDGHVPNILRQYEHHQEVEKIKLRLQGEYIRSSNDSSTKNSSRPRRRENYGRTKQLHISKILQE